MKTPAGNLTKETFIRNDFPNLPRTHPNIKGSVIKRYKAYSPEIEFDCIEVRFRDYTAGFVVGSKNLQMKIN